MSCYRFDWHSTFFVLFPVPKYSSYNDIVHFGRFNWWINSNRIMNRIWIDNDSCGKKKSFWFYLIVSYFFPIKE